VKVSNLELKEPISTSSFKKLQVFKGQSSKGNFNKNYINNGINGRSSSNKYIESITHGNYNSYGTLSNLNTDPAEYQMPTNPDIFYSKKPYMNMFTKGNSNSDYNELMKMSNYDTLPNIQTNINNNNINFNNNITNDKPIINDYENIISRMNRQENLDLKHSNNLDIRSKTFGNMRNMGNIGSLSSIRNFGKLNSQKLITNKDRGKVITEYITFPKKIFSNTIRNDNSSSVFLESLNNFGDNGKQKGTSTDALERFIEIEKKKKNLMQKLDIKEDIEDAVRKLEKADTENNETASLHSGEVQKDNKPNENENNEIAIVKEIEIVIDNKENKIVVSNQHDQLLSNYIYLYYKFFLILIFIIRSNK